MDQACRRLRLPTIRAVLEEVLTVAGREQLSYQGFLAECDDRDRRSSIRRVKSAGFPRDKWLGDFDFDANPNISQATIHTLATGDWIRKGQPLCLIGDSGTGKSHLLIGLGTAAAEKGFKVMYTLASRLVNELVEAENDKALAKTVARYGRSKPGPAPTASPTHWPNKRPAKPPPGSSMCARAGWHAGGSR